MTPPLQTPPPWARRPEQVDEEKQEMTARGQGAEQLEPLEAPSSRSAAAGQGADGAGTAAADSLARRLV